MRSCAGAAASTTSSSPVATSARQRLARVASLLVTIASREELRNAPQLRKVSLHGDRVDLDVDEHWELLPTLIRRVRGVKGIGEIRINGRVLDPEQAPPPGRDLGLTISSRRRRRCVRRRPTRPDRSRARRSGCR